MQESVLSEPDIKVYSSIDSIQLTSKDRDTIQKMFIDDTAYIDVKFLNIKKDIQEHSSIIVELNDTSITCKKDSCETVWRNENNTEITLMGKSDYDDIQKAMGSIKSGIVCATLTLPLVILNTSSIEKDTDIKSLSLIMFLTEMVTMYSVGYYSKGERFIFDYSVGGNISLYDDSYMLGVNGGLYTGFRLIGDLSAGLEYHLITSKSIQLYTPFTIRYGFQINEHGKLILSTGVGHTYDIYTPASNNDASFFDFLNKYSMYKCALSYKAEKYGLTLSFFYDRLFASLKKNGSFGPRIISVSYGHNI